MLQHVVNKLLVFNGPVPFQEVRTWFLPAHKALQNKTLWRLKQLQILQGRGQEVWINDAFQKSLLNGFSKGNPGATPQIPANLTEIDNYSRSKWESVLYELVKGESHQSQDYPKRVKSFLGNLLKDSELISAGGRVTNSGFQFLLKDVTDQIWILLIHYLKSISDPSVLETTLHFIGDHVLFGRPGELITRKYPLVDLQLFEQFGLLMPVGKSSICATRLFTSLTGKKSALDFSQNGGESRGFLVVETNYRVYAYTSSPLQIATLALFIRLQDRFPNLVYGQLDMETVQGAMSHGITADQITQYLQVNVHPCMISKTSESESESVPFNGIPFTIIDQIKLWELNRNRIARRDGYLYQQFLSEREYEAALHEAKNINALLYAKPSNRLLIVSPEGHEHMRQFLKSLK